MTEVIAGIEQLLALLENKGINDIRTDPGITDPNYDPGWPKPRPSGGYNPHFLT